MNAFAIATASIRRSAGYCGATILVLAAVSPAIGDDIDRWTMQAANAKFQVYSYNCAPDFYEEVAFPVLPNGMEAPIASSSFRFEYGSNCRSYYNSVIAPMLDQLNPERQITASQE